jgi:hypothetical protein
MQELATKTKAFNQVAVALQITLFEVIQQAATLIHHAQQTAPRVVVTLVVLEMFCQVLDPAG